MADLLLGNHVLELVPPDQICPGEPTGPSRRFVSMKAGLPPQARDSPEKYSW